MTLKNCPTGLESFIEKTRRLSQNRYVRLFKLSVT